AVSAPAGALGDGPRPRGNRQLVRSPLRLPELRDERRVAELSTVGLPHLRRAVPEQPSPRPRPAEFCRALVRVRSDLRGAPCPRLGGDHPSGPDVAGRLELRTPPPRSDRHALRHGPDRARAPIRRAPRRGPWPLRQPGKAWSPFPP